jgi:dTDP-glucose pyrophosphorylase
MNEQLNWKQALMPESASIQEAILNLDLTALRIVLVIANDGRLLGTVSDGDIRRGLLKGLSLNESIATVIHRAPLVAPAQLSRDAVIQLMLANKVQQIPVVDVERRVVGLHVWDELNAPPARDNIMVIMAGGKGTRLRPHTESCPKPLLLVGGKPMLEHIIERAKADGIYRFVLAVHYLGHMIEEYFGNGEKWRVEIDYLREDTPLGTAGALSLLPLKPIQPLLVTNGDVMADIRYGEILDFHTRHGGVCATMAVRQHEWQHPFGVVNINGVDIVGFDEKPLVRTHINAGIYVLDPDALNYLSEGGACDMPALFERLQQGSRRTIAYPMYEPWLDVGRPDDLNHARSQHSFE